MSPLPERRRVLLASAAALAGLACGGDARATRLEALHWLCSGPAGSIPDLIARAIGEQLTITSGQRVLVDNRPGAAGRISVNALKAALPDGSTLLLAQGAIATVHPHLYTRLAHDPAVDLQPVSLAAEMSLALAVGPAVPAEVGTIAELVGWMRANPTRANIGSPGTGTLPHLLAAMLCGEAGVAWQHIGYSGGPPAVSSLLGGQIAALVLPEGLLRPHHLSRRLRVLATSGAERSTCLPDVPSFVEQGFPALVVREWFAFFAPATVPAARIADAGAALREAIARPALAVMLAEAGIVPVSSSAAALSMRIAAEGKFWARVLAAHAIHAD